MNEVKQRMSVTKLRTLHLMLILGVTCIVASIITNSSILAFIGLGLTFWGALLRYITPTRHVPLQLLTATASSNLTNIEKLLADSHLTAKGIYLPPKNLKDPESSLIFIPSDPQQTLPTSEESDGAKLYSKDPDGMFLTPPGLALAKLLEKELGTSFAKTDLKALQEKLPRLLIEKTEVAEDVEIKENGNTITIQLTNQIFIELHRETAKLTMTHESIGCALSSALACALAKATRKPITIENEEQSQDGKTTTIQYHMHEGTE